MMVIFYHEDDIEIESCEMAGVNVGEKVYFSFEGLLREPKLKETYSDDSIAIWEKYNNTEWVVEEVRYDIRGYASGAKVVCWAKVNQTAIKEGK